MSEECTQTVEIRNRLGLHVRSVTQMVKTADKFQSDVYIEREGFDRVNGKSIMSVLTLAAPKGSELTITTQGPDAQEALSALVALVENKFGEED